jgi:hypothetical protein
MDVRKMSNYNYEGPLRCSISEFQANGGKLEAAMAALRQDTEGDKAFYDYKNQPGSRPRAKSSRLLERRNIFRLTSYFQSMLFEQRPGL